MLRVTRTLSGALLAATLVPIAFASQTHVTTPSTWVLNLKESDFGGGPRMKSDVVTILTDTAKWLKYTDVTVDGDGKTWKTSWSGAADGKALPVKGMSGASYSEDAASDTQVMNLPDGTAISCGYSLSADKKKLTDKCVAKAKDGKTFNQTLIYDRTK